MRQALETALEALELMYACYKNPKWVSYKQQEQKILEQTVDTITAIKEALAQPEQCEYPRCACDNKESCKKKAQPEKEPDWKGLVLSHNADCESRCDMERCKYAPYFKANGRRCPTCPVYEIIDVDYTPPQRTWVGLTDDDIADCAEKMEASDPTDSFWREFTQAIEAKLKEKNT